MARRGWKPIVTLALVLAGPAALWGWIGFLEWWTLGDDVPGNHITAAFRWSLATSPDLTVVVLLFLTVIFVLPFGIVLGHVYGDWRKRK